MYYPNYINFPLRLSKMAGEKLLDGNPAIADLNDSNRPTKLAEYFMQLYDNQYTDAFEEIVDEVGEEKALERLLSLVMVRKC